MSGYSSYALKDVVRPSPKQQTHSNALYKLTASGQQSTKAMMAKSFNGSGSHAMRAKTAGT